MKGLAYVEIVEDYCGDKNLSLARCRSCGFVGGHAIDNRPLTLAVAKRHGKTCPELRADDVDERLLAALAEQKGVLSRHLRV